jgi:glycosyltransferase involved in cell wall biosynthesis
MPIPGFGAARQLWLAVRRSDALVVHDSLYVTSILALVFAKLMGRPVILMQHIAAIPFASPLLRTLMKMANLLITGAMLRWADRCVFISDTVRQELGGERFGELLFNGVDHAIFNRGATSKRGPRALAEAEQTTAKRRLLFVGRYVEKKGMAILRSLAHLRPDDTLFLAGSGPIRPQEWGLSNVVDLGPKGPTELAALYRSADVLILPSVGEGFPLVIQEAMACGLPVVCGSPTHRADPGAARWLRGVHIDLSDAEGSATRCAAAIDLKMLDIERAEMADYACERYNWTASAKRLLDLARRQALPA